MPAGGGQRPQLYAGSLVDVSYIADEVGKAKGGYVNTACAVARRKFPILGVLFANCTSLFVEEDIPSDKLGQNAQFASVAPSDRKGWIPDRPLRGGAVRKRTFPAAPVGDGSYLKARH